MEIQEKPKATVQDAIALLTGLPEGDSEEACIDRLQGVEQAKRILAAVQSEDTHKFTQRRKARECQLGVPTSLQLKGIEAEVGLARGESPYVGAALTHTAIALHTVLPNTLAALSQGVLSEYHARLVAQQTNHLSDEHRRKIDAAIARRLGGASSSQLRNLVQGHAYRLDRQASEQRAEKNKRGRRVYTDPASDGQVYVTAEIPTLQGLAILDTLTKLTNKRISSGEMLDAQGQPLTRDQIMADIFVELLTGQTTADAVTGEVVVLMHDTTFFGDDDLPAWIPGHGPLPAGAVKHWLSDPAAATFFRRMYTRPTDGQLVAMESTRRRFPDGLAKMLKIREDICATPWCNGPFQESDHRHRRADGGPTSWLNATGLCKRCNQRKENRGWTYSGTPDELIVTTPTGHSYTVGTRPPLAEIRYWDSDPPPDNLRVDIGWPSVDVTWATAA